MSEVLNVITKTQDDGSTIVYECGSAESDLIINNGDSVEILTEQQVIDLEEV